MDKNVKYEICRPQMRKHEGKWVYRRSAKNTNKLSHPNRERQDSTAMQNSTSKPHHWPRNELTVQDHRLPPSLSSAYSASSSEVLFFVAR